MKNNVDFVIFYQHKSRELDNISLLKYELEKRGYSVKISSVYAYKKKNFKNVKVVVAPFLYHNDNFRLFYNYVGEFNKIVNLQGEQVLSVEDVNNINSYMYPHGFAKEAVHLCWGNNSLKRLQKADVLSDKLEIVGPIQMDMLRSEFDNFYKSKEEMATKFNLKANKKWTMFVSSFAIGDASEKEIEDFAKGGSSIIDFKNICYESKTKTIEWIERYLLEYKDAEFIYRPHPAEQQDMRLSQLASKYKNFHLIDKLSVKYWIKVADEIINWFSTTIAEIFFANKNCAIIRPVEIRKDLDVDIMTGANFSTTYEEMLKQLKSEIFPIDNKLIYDYYDVQKTPSYIRICDVLEKVYKEDSYELDLEEIFKTTIPEAKSSFFKPQWIRNIKMSFLSFISVLNFKYNFPLPKKILLKTSEYRKIKRDYISDKEIKNNIKILKSFIKE